MILVVVSLMVLWLRFRLAERLVILAENILGAVMIELGDKTLINGQKARSGRAPIFKNRHERRASRHRP